MEGIPIPPAIARIVSAWSKEGGGEDPYGSSMKTWIFLDHRLLTVFEETCVKVFGQAMLGTDDKGDTRA